MEFLLTWVLFSAIMNGFSIARNEIISWLLVVVKIRRDTQAANGGRL